MSNAPNAPMSNAPTEIAELQDHLHNLTSRLFTDRFQNHIQQVRGTLYESAAEIARPSPRQKAIEASLRHMMLQPMPVYKAARRSARLFPANASFLTVPSDIRRTFLQDCLEVDMASSQLALVASLWDLPKIRAFLAAGNSFWQSMIDHLCSAFPTVATGRRSTTTSKGRSKATRTAAFSACGGGTSGALETPAASTAPT